MSQSVRISKGPGGWGSGLTLTPSATKNVVLSVTGGGIHPVAQKIATITGAEAVDGFKNHIADDRVLCAVINCGGTARIGVYPKKRIPTVDVYAGEPGGPLAQFITDDIFVSAVGEAQVVPAGQDGVATGAGGAGAGIAGPGVAGAGVAGAGGVGAPDDADSSTGNTHEDLHQVSENAEARREAATAAGGGGFSGFVVKFGTAIGYFINTLLSSGRQAIKLTLNTILPFMVYVSLLIGIVTYTGVSEWIAKGVSPMASSPLGLVALGIITALPFLSPILGPGAAIAQVVGVLMGTQIAQGALPVQYALPTLYAINGQVGCDFVPVGLALGEAQPETVSVGVPAVLFSRLITSPIAVVIAFLASFLI